MNPDGTLWKPSLYSLLCEKHFVSGKPSNDTANPDYIPSIFPTHGDPKNQNDINRYDRAKKRLEEGEQVCIFKNFLKFNQSLNSKG